MDESTKTYVLEKRSKLNPKQAAKAIKIKVKANVTEDRKYTKSKAGFFF